MIVLASSFHAVCVRALAVRDFARWLILVQSSAVAVCETWCGGSSSSLVECSATCDSTDGVRAQALMKRLELTIGEEPVSLRGG